MLRLIDRFLGELDSEQIEYCHWKSNAFIDRALRGEDDLDLLVGHSSRQAFLGILDKLDFKEALPPRGRLQIPGILSYYGYDETAPRLIHVHVHYKLILGQDMTKNYHLPIEMEYIRSSSREGRIRVPSPEFEFVVLVVRMVLKHSTWNTILSGLGHLSARELGEIDFLKGKTSWERIMRVLSDSLPILDASTFELCLRALSPGCPLRRRLSAGHRLQKLLNGCALRSKPKDIWLQYWRRASLAAKSRLLKLAPGKRMKNGGMLVAFVGGDGAGKTTVIKDISNWLGRHVLTATTHIGKPSWSWSTRLTRGLLKAGRILGLWSYTKVPLEHRDAGRADVFPGYPDLIRGLCTGRDRFLAYRKARRQADQGAVVICDRYPLPGFVAMDGPRIEWMAGSRSNTPFIRFLAGLEKRYYRALRPPDLLVVLRLDPETAVIRKTDERPDAVRARTREIWEKDWKGTAAQLIDASQTKEEVLLSVKRMLWAHL